MKAKKIIIGVVVVLVGLPLLAVFGLWIAGKREGAGVNTATIVIDRPAADVWSALADDKNLPKWVPYITETRPLGEGGLRVGAKMRMSFDLEGERGELENELTKVEPNRRLEFILKSIGDDNNGFVNEVIYTLEEKGGKTTLSLSERSRYFGIPALFEPVITPEAQKVLQENLARLKALVESSQSSQSSPSSPSSPPGGPVASP